MSDLKFVLESPPHRLDLFTAWLPRLAIVFVFLFVGASKFGSADGEWANIFDRIGFGQWFRYFTGAVQVTGALLLLLPWTRIVGAALLACTMVGAMAVDVVVLHSVGFALVPALLLSAVIVTAATGR